MTRNSHVAFLGTSRSGLGHLRRIANIARQIASRDPGVQMTLITNAEPAGLGRGDLAHFSSIVTCPTSDMVRWLVNAKVSLAVADTMALPCIGDYAGYTALILRETPQDKLGRFVRDDGRAWDVVIVPNAADHWMPDLPKDFARRVEPVGWVRRASGCRQDHEQSAGVVLATGGGGNDQTRALLYPVLDTLFRKSRSICKTGVTLRQALGPRADGQALIGVDEVFDPGADLNRVFRAADVVISTAGYNSVLELAGTDTPTLLVPIPRSLDDQAARVALWGPRLGFGMTPGRTDAAALWLADQIDRPRRRKPVDLGPDGAARAAEILLEMSCPVS
jgi:predicted glycosyltransferase